jgi:hypothetical protein
MSRALAGCVECRTKVKYSLIESFDYLNVYGLHVCHV